MGRQFVLFAALYLLFGGLCHAFDLDDQSQTTASGIEFYDFNYEAVPNETLWRAQFVLFNWTYVDKVEAAETDDALGPYIALGMFALLLIISIILDLLGCTHYIAVIKRNCNIPDKPEEEDVEQPEKWVQKSRVVINTSDNGASEEASAKPKTVITTKAKVEDETEC